MMGWLTPHRAGALGRQHFRGYQCGLCHHLGDQHGLVSRLAAGPDLVAFQVFLDVVGGTEAPLGLRPCVLVPLGRGRSTRQPTANTALAAAFGLWMGVEKARDDWRDEGRLLGFLAARVLEEPGERARRHLVEAGFPVDEVAGWLQAQAALERRPHASLDEAMAPTRAIGRLAFGFAARHHPERQAAASEIGDALSTWLFWVDGLLDWPRDVAAGRYNPLARSLAGRPAAVPPPELRDRALAGAALALDRISTALDELVLGADAAGGPVVGGLGAAFLRSVLVAGPRDRLARLRQLVPSPRATARDLLPPIRPWHQRLGVAAAAARQRLDAALRRHPLVFRLQATIALALAWVFPGRAWAQQWWPDAPLDTGVPAEGAPMLDTGGDTGLAPDGGAGIDPVANEPNLGDACANGWGFCQLDEFCDQNCCDPCCGESGACDTSGVCDVDCGQACSQ